MTIARACIAKPTILAVVCAAVATVGCGGGSPPSRQASGPPEVGVLEPVVRTLPEWRVFTGRLEAVDRVEVRARVTGFVETVHFDEGERVEAGDLLVTLDPRTFLAERDAARARVEEAEARLALAESEALRVEGLIESRAVSQEELDQRTRQVDTAKAALAGARASLESAELALGFTRIEAPVAGRVGEARVTEGNVVTGGTGAATVLTTIVSIDPIQLRFPVDEPTALTLRRVVDRAAAGGAGDVASDGRVPVELQLTGSERFDRVGYVDFLDNRIDDATGTLMVRGVFENADGALVPGAFGRVRMQLDPPEARMLVPEKALGVDQTQHTLRVLKDDDTVERRVVEIGSLVDGWRVIRSGLSRGERVVVEGVQVARPGSSVAPKALESMEPPS